MNPNPIYTELQSRDVFAQMLAQNRGAIVVKFGAEWCGPCKRCSEQVINRMQSLPSSAQCYIIDVDECIDVYAFLKGKKVVNGIPVILVYYPGASILAPTFSLTGADPVQIDQLFQKVYTDCSR